WYILVVGHQRRDNKSGTSKQSKEDDVQKVSLAVYVTNFPENFSAKDLWNAWKVYGYIVDSYIPNRKSKMGKRFGFVRFIHVKDSDRLVQNLCTVWIGSFKLYANVARFDRESVKNKVHSVNKETPTDTGGGNMSGGGSDRTYVNVVKNNHIQKDINIIPTMVLDDSCLNKEDFSQLVLVKEGFVNIDLKYMGGLWVMLVFSEDVSKKAFQVNESVGSWFSQIIQAHTDFVPEERVIWIEIEGVPCKWWSKNTFTRIASRWGHLLNAEELEEGGYHSNRMCIYSKINTAICESFKMAYHGKIYWVRAIEVPGWVPDFEEDCDSDEESIEDTLPNEGIGENITKHNDLDDLSDDEVVPDTCFEGKFANNNNHVTKAFVATNKSQTQLGFMSFTPKENYANLSGSSNVEGEDNAVENEQKDAKEEGEYGGSMIQMMEDIVQVGLTMGYDMSGCLNQKAKQEWVKKLCTTNKVNFVSLQETKMENIDLWCIKRCWGNVAFDYVYSEAIGPVGGILSLKQGDRCLLFFIYIVMEGCAVSVSKGVDAGVDTLRVDHAIQQIGCMALKFPFKYLGSMVGGRMTGTNEWTEVVNAMVNRLSNWEDYNHLHWGVPMTVLHNMEVIRARFFNGMDKKSRKPSWVSWNQVMASKDAGGLGVASLFALNRALLHMARLERLWRSSSSSVWLSIIREVNRLKDKGMDLISFIKPKCGNGTSISFWNSVWRGEVAFKDLVPRLYLLENMKDIPVASKLAHEEVDWSFRRKPRGGVEQMQMEILNQMLDGVILSDSYDRWVWSLEGSGNFSVSSIRKRIDSAFLPRGDMKTRWIKEVPIKVNIHAWKVLNDYLPTRFNLSRRGLEIGSINCPICNCMAESARHLFFSCELVKQIMLTITRWWDLDYQDTNSCEEWSAWLLSIRLPSKQKKIFEDVKRRSSGTIGLRTLILFLFDLAPC
ncbi:RNA-directed DNA polymerase, eukaryota, reverse transcriptase zinc-binding domain protein, partial [Tanacetum coccineum]